MQQANNGAAPSLALGARTADPVAAAQQSVFPRHSFAACELWWRNRGVPLASRALSDRSPPVTARSGRVGRESEHWVAIAHASLSCCNSPTSEHRASRAQRRAKLLHRASLDRGQRRRPNRLLLCIAAARGHSLSALRSNPAHSFTTKTVL